MISPHQFRELVVAPTLRRLAPVVPLEPSAENLLLGTALVESRLEYLAQLGGGPALGVYQVEPATHDDIWGSFVRYRPGLESKLRDLLPRTGRAAWGTDLVVNLAYATAIARLVYRRAPAALPDPDDPEALAAYHKRWYNTPLGATDPSESVVEFRRVVAGGEYARR